MKLAPRWKVLLQAIRIFNEHLKNGMVIFQDNKSLLLQFDDDTDLYVVDKETGELLVIYTEDGTPIELSDWMLEGMNYDVPNVYPMFDHD